MMTLADARQKLVVMEEESGSASGEVLLHLEDTRAELVLSNPKRRNALSIRMMRQLAEAVERLGATQIHLLCIRGEGGTFCAGGELNEVRQYLEHSDHGLEMSRAMTAILDGLGTLPILSCALIDGYAVGGGAEIAASCDLRMMHKDAWLHFVHRKLGVVPGWGATRRLVASLGPARTLDLLTRAQRMSADECFSLGLVHQVTDVSWSQAVDAYFEPNWGTETLLALKRQVRAAMSEARMGEESRAFASVWGHEKHQEALSRVFAVREGS